MYSEPPPPEPPPNGLWRPFAANSIWNTKIPDGVTVHPNSATMLGYSCDWGIGLTSGDWSNAVYNTDENTPREWINGIQVPVPYGATFPPTADGLVVILAWDEDRCYSLWQMTSRTSATSVVVYDGFINGMGYGPNGQEAGVGSAGIPNIGGLIRPEEIEAGVIPHMLVLCVRNSRSWSYGHGYPPASVTYGWVNSYDSIPIGARIQLNPALTESELRAYGLTDTGVIIAKALQDYGCMPRDQGGGTYLFAEWYGTGDWSSVGGRPDSCGLENIPITEYRVLEFGQYDALGSRVTGDLT